MYPAHLRQRFRTLTEGRQSDAADLDPRPRQRFRTHGTGSGLIVAGGFDTDT